MNPLFSAVLPTYNRASMISRAIESVINQSYTNWELIIVDDGSTDNTKEIIDSYNKADKRIKYFYQENSERSVARNNGISKAKGDWICFLDSDDLYNNNHLETFYNFISQHQFTKGLFFSGVSYGKYDESQQYYDNSGKNNLEFILLNTIGVPRACCHKNILMENKFQKNINMGEDIELWSRIIRKYPIYYHTKKTFIEINHSARSINNESKLINLKTIKHIFKNNQVRLSIKNKIYSDLYFQISKENYNEKKRLLFVIYILQSLVLNPFSYQTKYKINILWNMFIMNTEKLEKLIKNE